MMKTSFDVSDLATGRADGTTRYTYELAKRLPILDKDKHWVLHTPSKIKDAYKISRSNIKESITPWPKYWTQMRLPFDLLRHKPDVLFMPIQQLPILRSGKVKTVAVVHDLAFHEFGSAHTYKDWLLLHAFSANVARSADHIIAVSQSTANDIDKYYGRKNNVHVVHHGVDHERFNVNRAGDGKLWQEIKTKYSVITKPYLLYVGQIQPRKNLVRMIRAFEQISHSEKYQLVIAGSHGWLNKPIFEMAKKSKRSSDIIFTGRVSDKLLPALYGHAELFLFPSLYEGFGMPILEAQACGCPVVTSNTSSCPEVAGGAAVLVNPIDVQSVIDGIESAIRQKDKLIDVGINNANKFTWDKTASETYDVINMAID